MSSGDGIARCDTYPLTSINDQPCLTLFAERPPDPSTRISSAEHQFAVWAAEPRLNPVPEGPPSVSVRKFAKRDDVFGLISNPIPFSLVLAAIATPIRGEGNVARWSADTGRHATGCSDNSAQKLAKPHNKK
jgi:hypothetical protein